MIKNVIYATDINGELRKSCTYEEIKTCPRCKRGFSITIIDSRYINNTDNVTTDKYSLYILYHCRECRKCFITEYENGYLSNGTLTFRLPKSYPENENESVNCDEINTLSERFENIYKQSLKAERLNLNEIAGMGYRKSLEILIFDYCLFKNLATEEELKKMTLANVIANKVNSPEIQATASRAAWLGNDHSHYFFKHENYDITVLKDLIDLTIHWIKMALLTEKYKIEITKDLNHQ